MKKIIAVICLVLAMATLLTACGKVKCDVCGKEVKNNQEERMIYEILDTKEKYYICRDCEDTVNALEDEGVDVFEWLKNK